MVKSAGMSSSLDKEISNLAEYIKSLNSEGCCNQGIRGRRVSIPVSTRIPSLPTIPSLPRSINNSADKPYDFLKIIEEESESDDEEEFSKVINKTSGKNFVKTKTTSYSKVDSYHSDISKISESETLYCKENNINYKKFGHYISLEIDGDGKRIYDMLDIYNQCTPVKEVKLIEQSKKVSLFTKIKNLFK
jgi:hypothetical protein